MLLPGSKIQSHTFLSPVDRFLNIKFVKKDQTRGLKFETFEITTKVTPLHSLWKKDIEAHSSAPTMPASLLNNYTIRNIAFGMCL